MKFFKTAFGEVFKQKLPEPQAEFLGKTLMIDGAPVVVKRAVGHRMKPNVLLINDKIEISILDAYSQLFGEVPTDEEREIFKNILGEFGEVKKVESDKRNS